MRKIALLFLLLGALQGLAQTFPTQNEALNNRARYNPVVLNNKSNHVGFMIDTAFRHAGFEVEVVGFQTTADGKQTWFNIVFKGGAPIMNLPVALINHKFESTTVYKAEWITRANTPNGIRCQIEYKERPKNGEVFVLVPNGPFKKANKKALKKAPAAIMEGDWVSSPWGEYRYPPTSPDDAVEMMMVDDVVIDEPAPVVEEIIEEKAYVVEEVRSVEAPEPTTMVKAYDSLKIYDVFEVSKPPVFPGGESEQNNFIAKTMQYPAIARENGVQGRVVVRVVVEHDGRLSDATILRDIGAGCGKEALRIVKNMPKWTPAEHQGRPVRCFYNLAVTFRLE